MIELYNISKTYRTQGETNRVLDGLSLTIERGEFVILSGKSGCGKSTLLSIIGMMEDCDANGVYRFLGEDVMMMTEREKALCRRKKMGFVFQDFNLVSDLSCLDNVEMTMGYDGVPAIIRRKRAMELLEQVGMRGKERHEPHQLSGGQQQRIAIARALSNEPKLILADEPTGNLDFGNTEEVIHLFERLNASGVTIIMVTHDERLYRCADRVLILRDGMLMEH